MFCMFRVTSINTVNEQINKRNYVSLMTLQFLLQKMLVQPNQQESSVLKKVLPRGTCLVSQLKKYEQMQNFVANPTCFRFILPLQAEFSSFVVIKTQSQKQYPIFQMFNQSNRVLLLSAQQQSMSIGCNYTISNSLTPSKKQNYVGKFRGTFQGDEFQLYDNGDNPERVKTKARRHLAFIKKQQASIWSGNQQTTKITMVVPKPSENSTQIDGTDQFEPLQFACTDKLANPLAKQSLKRDISTEVMKHRAGEPSYCCEKTFVLESDTNIEALTIRQKSSTYFEMNVGCPLTIMQGFGYLLSVVETFAL